MDAYLIYLRKSRQDRELELRTGNFDTLARHRAALLALAKDRGYNIAGILEEVVSGESIAERPKMQELLRLVESGEISAVLVMEVPRLARGNTRDQGIVAETFRYSNTKIITPDKVYDPANEADEEYFEFGLFMSRQEYKMINRRLSRGRMASFHEGKYIAGTAPYGYEKYKLPKQKGYSLRIVEDKAEVVRRIFHMYVTGVPGPDGEEKPVGTFRIAKALNAEGLPGPGGGTWTSVAVRDIIKNPTYTGKLRWGYRPVIKKVIGGSVTYSTPVSDTPQITQGLHEPIIPEETWTAAQRIMKSSKHSSVPAQRAMTNPMAGILFCSECGRSMVRMRSRTLYRVMCPTVGCPTISHRIEEVETALLASIQRWLDEYKLQAQPEIVAVQDDSSKQVQAALRRLQGNLETLRGQRSRLYDLLEQGVYTNEIFLERSRDLARRIDEAEAAVRIAEQAAKAKADAEQLRRNIVPRMENVLALYESLDSAAEKNKLLRSALEKVLYRKSSIRPAGESQFDLFIFPQMEQDSNI